MDKVFYLPIGLKIDGKEIVELPIAKTGGEAEKIFTKKPAQSKIHTWFGQVLSASIESINGEKIASEYLRADNTDRDEIPALVKKIPFIDCGSLLIQVQRECWEDMITDQKITCTNCGAKLNADIDLNRITIPNNGEGRKPVLEEYVVKLDVPYTISHPKVEQLKEYEGVEFNAIKFRVATLGDAIKREGIVKDQILFWREIAFDTMTDLLFIDEKGNEIPVAEGYITKIGKKLLTDTFTSKTLKKIRAGMQDTLPSAKFYYEEDCPECSQPTPFFATVSNFFSA